MFRKIIYITITQYNYEKKCVERTIIRGNHVNYVILTFMLSISVYGYWDKYTSICKRITYCCIIYICKYNYVGNLSIYQTIIKIIMFNLIYVVNVDVFPKMSLNTYYFVYLITIKPFSILIEILLIIISYY